MLKVVGLFVALVISLPLFVQAQTETLSSFVDIDRSGSIIVEADTYIPVFYNGRSEPVVGSAARFFVILSPDTAANAYLYQWWVGNKAHTQEPVVSQTYINTVVPLTGRDLPVGVRVYDTSGSLIAEVWEDIRLGEPKIVFYESNPLRGNSRTAIGDEYIMSGDEVTIEALPFFTNEQLFTKETALSWLLDGHEIENTNSNPRVLTIEHTGETSGSTRVTFELRDYVQNLFSIDDSFRLIF